MKIYGTKNAENLTILFTENDRIKKINFQKVNNNFASIKRRKQ